MGVKGSRNGNVLFEAPCQQEICMLFDCVVGTPDDNWCCSSWFPPWKHWRKDTYEQRRNPRWRRAFFFAEESRMKSSIPHPKPFSLIKMKAQPMA